MRKIAKDDDDDDEVTGEGNGRNSELVVLAKWASTSRLYSPQTSNPNTKKEILLGQDFFEI